MHAVHPPHVCPHQNEAAAARVWAPTYWRLLAASHTRTVMSSLQLASDRPSGLHATVRTHFECPCIGSITVSHPDHVGVIPRQPAAVRAQGRYGNLAAAPRHHWEVGDHVNVRTAGNEGMAKV
jgi:hypothetical protein